MTPGRTFRHIAANGVPPIWPRPTGFVTRSCERRSLGGVIYENVGPTARAVVAERQASAVYALSPSHFICLAKAKVNARGADPAGRSFEPCLCEGQLQPDGDAALFRPFSCHELGRADGDTTKNIGRCLPIQQLIERYQ